MKITTKKIKKMQKKSIKAFLKLCIQSSLIKEFGTAFHNLVALTPKVSPPPSHSVSRLKVRAEFKELFQLFDINVRI